MEVTSDAKSQKMRGGKFARRVLKRSAWMLLAAMLGLSAVPGRAPRAADPLPYTVDIAKTGNGTLDAAINDSSTLVSLQKSVPVGPFALVARAQGDRDRFLAALHGLGYYKGAVTLRIAGRPLDDEGLPDALDRAPADPPVKVTVGVATGPLFHLRRVTIEGMVPEAARARLMLAPGAPAVAADVLAARGRLLDALREQGYALAQVDEPVAILQADADALDVSFKVATGPRVDIGPIGVAGLKDTNESYVRERMLVHQGEQFSPSRIEAARQDLANTGIFSTVRATPAATLDRDGQLPLDFTFEERPRHGVTFTAAYSTDLGASIGSTFQYRNVFGNGETINLSAQATGGGSAQRDPGYSVNAQFLKPDFLRRDLTLQADVGAVREDLQAYKRTAILGDLLFNQKLSKEWSVSIGLAAEQEKVFQEFVTRNYTLVGLPVGAKYDSTDNLFEPTQGIRANASVTPTESLGHQNTTFVLLQATGSTYLDLSTLWGEKGRSVLALRGLVGGAEGATQFALPPDKRFYAGGSATVRGYKYQSVGPRFADNNPQGGTAVTTGTVEFRQRILESFGAVAFVDGGQVAANGGPFTGNLTLGAGVGARYYTSIGPIRVDVAVPLNKRPGDDTLELYIGIGEAF
jgi:translocation and assembly module TamA